MCLYRHHSCPSSSSRLSLFDSRLFLYFFIIFYFFFFFNDTATTEIYTLSLHDALPISGWYGCRRGCRGGAPAGAPRTGAPRRSEEHTSELQSQSNLVCRLLLEKKKKKTKKK